MIAGSTLVAIGLFLTLLIGLREQVGGDWFNYFPYLNRARGLPFAAMLLSNEPGYGLLNWVGANVGGSIYFVNTICGLVFTVGLLLFCRSQPRPWLALCLAFPYLVTVVAMGYSRQGVAIGLEMIALLLCSVNACCIPPWLLGFQLSSPRAGADGVASRHPLGITALLADHPFCFARSFSLWAVFSCD